MIMKADLFFVILFFSALNCGLMTIAIKWDLIDRLKAKTRNRTIFQLLSCEFCMFFWASALFELMPIYLTNCPFNFFGMIMIIPFALCCSVFSCALLRSNH